LKKQASHQACKKAATHCSPGADFR
jgi:hypothetical protein